MCWLGDVDLPIMHLKVCVSFQKRELTDEVTKLEKEHSAIEQETKQMVADLGDTQHQKLTAGKKQQRKASSYFNRQKYRYL